MLVVYYIRLEAANGAQWLAADNKKISKGRVKMSVLKNMAFLAGGFLIGTAGVKILSSKEAKKVYAHTTAAVIRAKDCVMTGVTKVREGCDDILADAHDINEIFCSRNELY